jgi:Ca2+-binding EF-hand superfamily protein
MDLADTMNLDDFRQPELDRAFELVDSDGNGRIDEDEVSTLRMTF